MDVSVGRYTRADMPGSVLEAGRRRRRRRARRKQRRLRLLLGVLLVSSAGVGAWQLWPAGEAGATPSAGAAARERPAARHVAERTFASATRARTPLLSVRGPLPHARLRISAPEAILVDAGTGAVLWARRPHARRPIASTTKIMTAIVAMSLLRPDDVVVVPKEATLVQPTKEGLRTGERVPAWKMLYALMLVSGNDDAVALADAAGGTKWHFVALMNEKARRLGLVDTHYRSPSGLVDVGNYSSAWDLAALTRYALWNPRFREIVRTRVKKVSWPLPTGGKIYVNHNKLLSWYPGADGVKTGWTTKAGHCLVASATRHGRRLIAVVLDAPDHYGDAIKLLNYGFKTPT